jgi:hypothetical protein
MRSRSRVLKAFLALLVLSLSVLVFLLAQHPRDAALPHKHQAQRSVFLLTPPPFPLCPDSNARGFVVVFFHHAGVRNVRCISQQPATDDTVNWNEQVLKTPLAGVYEACASGVPAMVSYHSWEDPNVKANDAIGSIDLFLRDGECTSVQRAVQMAAMMVTSVVIGPFFGGVGVPEPTPVPLIHQVPAGECAARADFFTIWYAGGRRNICFANAGLLTLSQPLTGVVKVCGGLKSGEVFFEENPSHAFLSSMLELRLGSSEPQQCVTPTMLLGEASLTVNTIAIDPVS